MHEVWFLFKIIETIVGLVCLSIHVRGFVDAKMTSDNYIYITVFFTFTLHAMFTSLNICAGKIPSPIHEAIVNTIAACMYLCAAIETMYHAEKDFYLMYLSEFEAPIHPYFRYSKGQSIAAVINSTMYMLHATLIFDMLTITEEIEFDDDDDHDAIQPIKLYFFARATQEKLTQFEWFRKFSNPVPNSV